MGNSVRGCQMKGFALFLALSSQPEYYGVPGVAMSYEPIVNYWADIYRVPRSLAMKILAVESGANPRAVGSEWVLSKGRWIRGKTLAEGSFMIAKDPQHRADHLRRAGIRWWRFDPWNVSDSARVGLSFLGSLLRYFPDRRPAVAAYNCGLGRAARWYYGGESLPPETRGYVLKVLGVRHD